MTNDVEGWSKEIATHSVLLVVVGVLSQGLIVFGSGRTVIAWGLIIHVA